MKNIVNISAVIVAIFLVLPSCTDLEEHPYGQLMSTSYYNSRDDVLSAVSLAFSNAFLGELDHFETEEQSADQLITPTRDTWWTDDHKWERQHRHAWTLDQGPDSFNRAWVKWYTIIGQANMVIDDLGRLNLSDIGVSETEKNYFISQLRCIRAYEHWLLLNSYRNIIICNTSDPDILALEESQTQVPPSVAFEWIEGELLDLLNTLPSKTGNQGNGINQGMFTKAAAATILIRMYLNSQKYTGVARWEECRAMCKRITSGEFGSYSVAANWYEPFDWNNETSNEVIFAFPSSFSTSHWHLSSTYLTIYWRTCPIGAEQYFGIKKNGSTNPKYALSPSYDNDGNLFNYKLGMVTQKFLKYPGDVRYKQYKNLGNNKREGMFFLEGYVTTTTGAIYKRNGYDVYLLDRVGRYHEGAAQKTIPAGNPTESTYANGDFNSGLYVVKYPFYPENESGCLEEDFVLMRLPEIIYSQAESELRLGNVEEAGKLLNSVRKRNYPQETWSANLYAPEGKATLDIDEMLDEWGREFISESRRRTDLIRFGRFGEAWWDKPADADDHWELFSFERKDLNSNKYLKQNPGYEDIER